MREEKEELGKELKELGKTSGKVLYHIFVIIGLIAFLVVLIVKVIMRGGI